MTITVEDFNLPTAEPLLPSERTGHGAAAWLCTKRTMATMAAPRKPWGRRMMASRWEKEWKSED